ncbi:MAG TPA: Holliday junction resolvase RuvX, partial [Deinococcales bacterium]|nr:Holliday junction resolvase RuvX [Deinococcales bacterium]
GGYNPRVTQGKPLPAIALDVGEARIGLAACDRSGRFAFGRGYHVRGKGREGTAAAVAAVRELFEREGAAVVVVGLPLRTDGRDSPQTNRVRAFAAALEEAGLPVRLVDERFTTRIAGQALLAAKSKAQRREKGLTDEASAVAILETYLQRA